MMKDKEIMIPPFVQDYINKVDGNGLSDFVKISAEYQKNKEDYPGIYAVQAENLNRHNRSFGTKHTLNYEKGLQRLEADFRKKAYDTAKKHGYTGPDPNQPSDKEFTKQGEKFQSMIDDVRQRREEQMQQAEQKQETEQSQDKKNIDVLKEQQPYQQQQPKVEFQRSEQPSGTGQPNREEIRAAFLDKIKQVREKQMQWQQNKQPEI